MKERKVFLANYVYHGKFMLKCQQQSKFECQTCSVSDNTIHNLYAAPFKICTRKFPKTNISWIFFNWTKCTWHIGPSNEIPRNSGNLRIHQRSILNFFEGDAGGEGDKGSWIKTLDTVLVLSGLDAVLNMKMLYMRLRRWCKKMRHSVLEGVKT